MRSRNRRQAIEDYLRTGRYGSDHETAKMFNTKRGYIANIRRNLGLPTRVLPRLNHEDILFYIQSNSTLTDQAVADALDISVSSARRVRVTASIPSRGTRS